MESDVLHTAPVTLPAPERPLATNKVEHADAPVATTRQPPPQPQTVVLGTAAYATTLTVAVTGDLAPTTGGSAGIFVPRRVQSAKISNQVQVNGAAGAAAGGNGGIGVILVSAASISNSGTIAGGTSTYNHNDPVSTVFRGGNGVDLLAGGSISNTGLIKGGAAYGFDYNAGADGGVGVALSGGTLANQGTTHGGQPVSQARERAAVMVATAPSRDHPD